MAEMSEDGAWPEGFISDAARALTAIDEIQEAVPALVDRPLDPTAQDRMRAVLASGRLQLANEAARRLAVLPNSVGEVA